jgi:hypothetical protein
MCASSSAIKGMGATPSVQYPIHSYPRKCQSLPHSSTRTRMAKSEGPKRSCGSAAEACFATAPCGFRLMQVQAKPFFALNFPRIAATIPC